MKRIFKILLVLMTLTSLSVSAQDTLVIEKVKKVNKNQTLTISAGTTVVFRPGAMLWVEGSLSFEGEKNNPIILKSLYPENPGIGIIINGSATSATINIKHTEFVNIARPISFEPYWSRKKVILDRLKIHGSSYKEAVIFVANPLIDLKVEPIQFKLTNSEFYNNQSGILIENAGIKGIQYELNSLLFQQNTIAGNDPSLGILHLNIGQPYAQDNLKLGNLAFHQNKAGNTPIGLSLSGDRAEIKAKGVYNSGSERPIFDYQTDPRLPSLTSENLDLKEWPEDFCYLNYIKHTSQTILAFGSKSCAISKILDSLGNPLTFIQAFKMDSLFINYSDGIAKTIVMNNGLLVDIPLPSDINLDSLYKKRNLDNKEKSDSLIIKEDKNTFPSYELGAWGGLAFYIGDIKHKFGIPGTYEWSGGLFLQYNRNPSWSYRMSYYRTNIGMHDPTAPLQVWQSAPTFINQNGKIQMQQSWALNFLTKMHILDFEAIYYFVPKNNYSHSLDKNIKGKFIPGFGFGASFMKYDPYKNLVYSRSKDTAVFVPLRPLGMEGQNFLANKRDYGKFTMNLNVSFQLVYLYKNMRFRYELKASLSMSDYLDDYGQGYTYGGNYKNWVNNAPDIDLGYDKVNNREITLENSFPNYSNSYKRSTNLLPDMFFSQHIGVSYDLSTLIGKVKKLRAK
jgi:hypothetical protein